MEGLIHAGAYFRNFTVSIGRVSRGREPIDSYIDNIKRDTSLDSISEVRSAMLDRNVGKDFVIRLDPEVGLSKYVLNSLSYFACFVFISLGRYSDLQVQYNEAVNTVKEQKELITQLETDLLSVNALPSAFRGQGEVRIVVCKYSK